MLEQRTRTRDDQALISAFRAGDDAAFGQIFARHHDVLLRYASRVLGRSSEHVEDVVQEAMFRASRALRRDERHIELRPWLFRLVRNCALDELARRARANLVKHEEARSTDCQDVRLALLEAHDEGRRASAAAYRHIATCRGCRTFRSGLKDTSRAVAMLVPAPLILVTIGVLAGKVGAVGAKGAMLKTGATAAAGTAVATGLVVGALEVFGPGDPAPQSATSLALAKGHVAKGAPLPPGTAMISRTVHVAPGAPRSTILTMPCPPGLRVADLLALHGASAAYAPETIPGTSRSARVHVEPRPGASSTRLSLLCKAPDARGSIVAGGAAGGPTRRVRVARSELFVRPGGAAVGSVRFGQPVQALGRATTAGWQRIRTDAGATGWVRLTTVRSPPSPRASP